MIPFTHFPYWFVSDIVTTTALLEHDNGENFHPPHYHICYRDIYLLLSVLALPSCVLGLIALVTCKLDDETFGREVRRDVNVKQDSILLIGVLLYLQPLERLNESARTLYTIPKNNDLRTKVCFGVSSSSQTLYG